MNPHCAVTKVLGLCASCTIFIVLQQWLPPPPQGAAAAAGNRRRRRRRGPPPPSGTAAAAAAAAGGRRRGPPPPPGAAAAAAAAGATSPQSQGSHPVRPTGPQYNVTMRGRSLAGDGGFRQGSDGGRRPFLFLNFYKGKRDGYESGINFHTGCLCVVRRWYEVLQKLVRSEYEGGTKVVRRVRKWYKFPHGMLVRGTRAVRSVAKTGTKRVRRVRKWYNFPHGMLARGTRAVRSVAKTGTKRVRRWYEGGTKGTKVV